MKRKEYVKVPARLKPSRMWAVGGLTSLPWTKAEKSWDYFTSNLSSEAMGGKLNLTFWIFTGFNSVIVIHARDQAKPSWVLLISFCCSILGLEIQ